MCAVLLEVIPLPHETIRARRHSVYPKVRSPESQRRRFFGVIETSRTRVRRHATNLVYLRLYQPLDGKSFFVGVRLGIPVRRRVAAIGAARKENEQQIRISYPQRAKD